MNQLTYDNLQRACHDSGGRFFDQGDYNLNIVGIRTDDNRSNLFNDWLCLAFRQQGAPILLVFCATTDPGTYWRQNPMNVNGTAILKAGHYPGAFRIGLHRGKYEALVQNAPVAVFRDKNKDEVLDTGPGTTTETGMFGINLHRASSLDDPHEVNQWSAGCQVIASNADFSLFMAICERAVREHGPAFSYSLLDEAELWR